MTSTIAVNPMIRTKVANANTVFAVTLKTRLTVTAPVAVRLGVDVARFSSSSHAHFFAFHVTWSPSLKQVVYT